MGFKKLGSEVLISRKASIYEACKMEIGDNSRIDDFCCISGNIKIGRNCHITPYCLLAGGTPGIEINDYCTLAYRVSIFSQSDDYSGESMANSTIPRRFKNEYMARVLLEEHVIIGCGSVIFPGVVVNKGSAIGALSLVNRSTIPWSINFGIPSLPQGERSKNLLDKLKSFLCT
jgi:acetyltransferase-like isoleucine patch superfamily enzyme